MVENQRALVANQTADKSDTRQIQFYFIGASE